MAEPCLISARGQFDRHHVSGVSILPVGVIGGAISDRISPSRRVNGITLALITTARHAVADRRARLYPRRWYCCGSLSFLACITAHGRGVNRSDASLCAYWFRWPLASGDDFWRPGRRPSLPRW